MFSTKDYSYTLPENRIAQEATNPHHNAKMMVIEKGSGEREADDIFWNLDHYLQENRVLFFNNSKVLRSRIPLKDIPYKRNDGTTNILQEGEIFFLKHSEYPHTFEALVRPGNKFRIGTMFFLNNCVISVIGSTDSGRVLRIEGTDISSLMESHGQLPLPPYITYKKEKETDYQTSFAKQEGSVAAPTASLHFTTALLEKITQKKEFVTLHVGLGTFKGIDTQDVRDYEIHEETIEIETKLFSKIREGKQNREKIVAVGTTVCRTLESLPYVWKSFDTTTKELFDIETQSYWNGITQDIEHKDWIRGINHISGERKIIFSSSIYIIPGHTFYIVDELITNFHLPESSLLVLVSAFLGHDETMRCYTYAIENNYRFYSFGDGMYIRCGG